MIGARSKINAISLNVKINKWKSVGICGYKLTINVQNFMQKDSTWAKIWSKVVGGLLFLTHPVDVALEWFFPITELRLQMTNSKLVDFCVSCIWVFCSVCSEPSWAEMLKKMLHCVTWRCVELRVIVTDWHTNSNSNSIDDRRRVLYS